jgi:hypothetical protein
MQGASLTFVGVLACVVDRISVVQEDGRARGRAQRAPHLGVGAGPMGVAAGGHLRRAALRHARRRARRHRRRLPHRHPAVQGHDRGYAHGPQEVAVPDLRRALPLLLLRRRHRRADGRAGDGHLPGVQGQDRGCLPGGANILRDVGEEYVVSYSLQDGDVYHQFQYCFHTCFTCAFILTICFTCVFTN